MNNSMSQEMPKTKHLSKDVEKRTLHSSQIWIDKMRKSRYSTPMNHTPTTSIAVSPGEARAKYNKKSTSNIYVTPKTSRSELNSAQGSVHTDSTSSNRMTDMNDYVNNKQNDFFENIIKTVVFKLSKEFVMTPRTATSPSVSTDIDESVSIAVPADLDIKKITELQEQVKLLQSENDDVRKQLSAMKSTAAQADFDIIKKFTELQDQVIRSQHESGDLKKQLSTVKSTVAEIDNTIKNFAETQDQVIRSQHENEYHKIQLSAIKSTVAEVDNAMKNFVETQEQVKCSQRDVKKQLLTIENAAVQADLNVMKKFTELQEQMIYSQHDNDDIKKQLSDIKSAAVQIDCDIMKKFTKLQDQIKRLQNENDDVKKELFTIKRTAYQADLEVTKKFTELEEHIKSLQYENGDLKVKLSAVKNTVTVREVPQIREVRVPQLCSSSQISEVKVPKIYSASQDFYAPQIREVRSSRMYEAPRHSCKCTLDCSTRRCGCRKLDIGCTSSCGCSSVMCQN